MRREHQLRCALAVVTGSFAIISTKPVLAEPSQVEPGHAVYDKWCSACHDPGIAHPGTHALMTKYKGVKSGVLLEWTDLPVPLVKFVVRHGISVMPQFRKTEISDPELDALATYLSRNSK